MAQLSDAEQDQVDALRPLVGLTDLTDDDLHAFIVAAGGSLDGSAAEVYRRKAASAADFVDVREGSSTRALSQLRAAYVAQAAVFEARADAADTSGGGSTVSRFRRLTRGDR